MIVASPRRAYLPGEFEYGKQVDWETYYLRRAAENGVILFWPGREEGHIPSRAYAQTPRFELAEWKMHLLAPLLETCEKALEVIFSSPV